jgi:tetratricopeptide (TPR) repeat protein
MDAYDAYLRGRELIHLRVKESLEDAIRHLKHSLRLDDNFAPAHAHLAIATALLVQEGATTPEEASRIAVPHLDRAQELEPDLAEAHGGRALLALVNNEPKSAVEHARKALASNPGYSDAMVWLGNALGALGRYEEWDPILEQILVTDPFNLVARFNYAEWLGEIERVDEAHEMADQLLAENPIFGYQTHAWTSFAYEGEIAEGLYWGLMRDREELGSGWVMAAFAWVGEYDEARRITDDLAYVYRFEGRFDEAIEVTQERMRLKPNDQGAIWDAAYTLYLAGRIDEALPHYERLLDFVPEGRPIPGYLPMVQTMRLALARRKAGDEVGAQAAALIAKQDHAARRAAGRKDQHQDLAEAMIAAFENNTDRVIPALKSGVRHGLRYLSFFDDPIFEDLRGEPRFVAVKEELGEILDAEHDKVLQLICFNNPTPDNWQPLLETCEGVVDRG